MGLPTRPSNVRVYQFHHFGTYSAALWIAFETLVNELISWVEFPSDPINIFPLRLRSRAIFPLPFQIILMATPEPVLTTPTSEEHWVGAFFDVDNTLVPGPSTEVRFFQHLWKLGLIGLPQFLKSAWFLIQHVPPLSLSPLRRNKLYLVGQNPEVIEPLAKEFIQTTICPPSVLSRRIRALSPSA